MPVGSHFGGSKYRETCRDLDEYSPPISLRKVAVRDTCTVEKHFAIFISLSPYTCDYRKKNIGTCDLRKFVVNPCSVLDVLYLVILKRKKNPGTSDKMLRFLPNTSQP